METNEYLRAVLAAQQLKDDSARIEGAAIRTSERVEENNSARSFGSVPTTIRYGGSKAKGESDQGILRPHRFESATFRSTAMPVGRLWRTYIATSVIAFRLLITVDEKTSALRLKSKDPKEYMRDFHIDVIPRPIHGPTRRATASFTRNRRRKCRLKTNLDVHISHIKNSGVLDALCLLKTVENPKGNQTQEFRV